MAATIIHSYETNPEKLSRSQLMSRIRSKDTAPELAVRKLVFSLGYRYRKHYNLLPGKPDLVFIGRRKVIFIHGCFWHQHKNCKVSHIPKTNTQFWTEKLNKNCLRDITNEQTLIKDGWKVLIIWECEVKNPESLKHKIINFLQ